VVGRWIAAMLMLVAVSKHAGAQTQSLVPPLYPLFRADAIGAR
jgi:hypothetical protein